MSDDLIKKFLGSSITRNAANNSKTGKTEINLNNIRLTQKSTNFNKSPISNERVLK